MAASPHGDRAEHLHWFTSSTASASLSYLALCRSCVRKGRFAALPIDSAPVDDLELLRADYKFSRFHCLCCRHHWSGPLSSMDKELANLFASTEDRICPTCQTHRDRLPCAIAPSQLARLYAAMTPEGVYVGVTSQSLSDRAAHHLSAMRRATQRGEVLTPFQRALHGCHQDHGYPCVPLRLIDYCDIKDVAARETGLIAQLQAAGVPLLNRSRGGNGSIAGRAGDRTTLIGHALLVSSYARALNQPGATILTVVSEGDMIHITQRRVGVRHTGPIWGINAYMFRDWMEFACRQPGQMEDCMPATQGAAAVRARGRMLSLAVPHVGHVAALHITMGDDLIRFQVQPRVGGALPSRPDARFLKVCVSTLSAYLQIVVP